MSPVPDRCSALSPYLLLPGPCGLLGSEQVTFSRTGNKLSSPDSSGGAENKWGDRMSQNRKEKRHDTTDTHSIKINPKIFTDTPLSHKVTKINL